MNYTEYTTMEFATDEEAREFARDNNIRYERLDDSSYGVQIKLKSNSRLEFEEDNTKYIIFSHLNSNSKLYVYKSGLPQKYGYEQMYAKVFTSLEEAKKVTAIMSRRGARRWLVEQLVSRY